MQCFLALADFDEPSKGLETSSSEWSCDCCCQAACTAAAAVVATAASAAAQIAAAAFADDEVHLQVEKAWLVGSGPPVLPLLPRPLCAADLQQQALRYSRIIAKPSTISSTMLGTSLCGEKRLGIT